MTRLNADEALFAGLVHDIGRFYLLSRAAAYPDLVAHPDELDALIHEWHPSIGQAVLHEFDLAEPALRGGRRARAPRAVPRRRAQLVDVITHRQSRRRCRPIRRATRRTSSATCRRSTRGVVQLISESAEEVRTLLMALRG